MNKMTPEELDHFFAIPDFLKRDSEEERAAAKALVEQMARNSGAGRTNWVMPRKVSEVKAERAEQREADKEARKLERQKRREELQKKFAISEENPAAPAATKPVSKPSTPRVKRERGSNKYNPNSVIRVLVKDNPKRPGSLGHTKFACFIDGMTVAEFYEAGMAAIADKGKWMNGELDFCIKKGFIKLED